MADDVPVLVPIGEVAQRFGVGRTTVRNWERAGKLDSFRTLGGHRRYRLADIEAIVEEQGRSVA